MKQQEDGALDAFHTRLRKASDSCEFHDKELEIEQQIIVGGKSSTIRKKALRKPDYTLKEMLIDGRGKGSSNFQSKDIEWRIKEEFLEKLAIPTQKRGIGERKCFNCGGNFPHEKSCPARGKQCGTCLKYNHFSACCWQNSQRKATNTLKIKQIKEVCTKQKSVTYKSRGVVDSDIYIVI